MCKPSKHRSPSTLSLRSSLSINVHINILSVESLLLSAKSRCVASHSLKTRQTNVAVTFGSHGQLQIYIYTHGELYIYVRVYVYIYINEVSLLESCANFRNMRRTRPANATTSALHQGATNE